MNSNHRKNESARVFYFVMLLQLMFLSTKTFPQDYTFNQLKIEDGLSQSTVLASLQDSKGYMWFVTRSGLNKYDGYK